MFWIILFAVVFLVSSSVVLIEQQHVAIIERLGKYNRTMEAGINFRIPLIESVVEDMSLRQEQQVFKVDTKTKDNVFVKLSIALQYQVQDAYSAYYKLDDFVEQMESYLINTIRAYIPTLNLDDLFADQNNVTDHIYEVLAPAFNGFGIKINAALIYNITPDEAVVAAMNKINEAQRLKVAAETKAEADKIIVIKQAEAEAESKKLQGEGIAKQREAIAQGLRASSEMLTAAGTENPLQYVLLTQYFDTLGHMASNNNSKVIFMPSSPDGMSGIMAQIISATEGAKNE